MDKTPAVKDLSIIFITIGNVETIVLFIKLIGNLSVSTAVEIASLFTMGEKFKLYQNNKRFKKIKV